MNAVTKQRSNNNCNYHNIKYSYSWNQSRWKDPL